MPRVTLKLYGDIGEPDPMMEMFGMTDDTISSKQVSEFLEANTAATEILVRINSRGGDVQEGWNIYDLLTTCGKKITTRGEGKIYSIATIIFLAGTEREMMQNADGLIHNPYIPPYTLAGAYESGDLLKIAEGLQQEEEKILDFYAEKTGTAKDKLAGYMKDETKLSAEDMLTLGFATKIVEPVKAYAYVKPKNHLNMTPQEEATFWGKVEAKITATMQALGLSRLPAEQAMEMTDKDGKKFTIDKASGEPAVGDTGSPDGSFVMANGKTITISGGKVTEVKEPAADASATELETLKAENARLAKEVEDTKAAAAAKVEEETAAATTLAAEKAALAEEKTKYSNLVGELRALKNEWKPSARLDSNGKVVTTNPEQPFDVEEIKAIQAKIKETKSE
jgi:ATP-dependent protease ClpP protease subunit